MSTMGDDAGDLLFLSPDEILARVRFDSAGLVPAIAQDSTSRQVLMLAWMNEEALRTTMTTRRATYFSRSRQGLWVKGGGGGVGIWGPDWFATDKNSCIKCVCV